MKRLILYSIFSAVTLFGCSNEDQLTPNEKTEKLLREQIWELSQTKIDNVISSQYDGLTLSFGPNTYSTTNGQSLWEPNGAWQFIGNKGDKIIRDDGLLIDVININASQLVLTFDWNVTIYDGGRASSVTGFHEMTFDRQP